jgi:hypothetical protein
MGVVHLARAPDGSLVALKVLRPWIAEDVNARRRLIREVETMRRVRSPFVAEVLDADVNGEFPYIVTRFVSGPTLDEMVRRQGPLAAAGVQRLAAGLAEALAAIHAAGIVHRDLKPGNVMLTDDRPVVIDFGIAQAPEATRLTQTGMVMGTPGYLAPEVIEGQPSSPASDVHSWGATVAFAATGRPPYGTGSFETIFFRVISGRADLAGVPAPLVPLVSAALSRDPARRPPAAWLSTQASSPSPAAYAAPAPVSYALDARTLTALGPPATPAAAAALAKPAPPLAGPSGTALGPSVPLLPPGPIGRAGIPDDPPSSRRPRADRLDRAERSVSPNWLPGLAFTVAAAALTVVLPVAGLVASLALITLLRAADMAQHRLGIRRSERGPRPSDPLLVIVLAPLSVARAVLTTAMLVPLALAAGTLAWAATIVATHHANAPKAPAFAAAAVVVFYGIGPGSRRPRRQLRKIFGPFARTPMSAAVAAIATWALAAAAVTFAMSQPPYYWPAVAPVFPHTAVMPHLPVPHLPMLPKLPSLHSLLTSTATWLTRHTHL